MIDLSTVVVTGLGTVDAAGCGRQSIATAFRDGTTHWLPVDRSAGYHFDESSQLAGLTHGLDLRPWLAPAKARRMSLPSKLAVAATQMALEDAGREPGESGEDLPTAVVVSTAHGPTSLIEGILRQSAANGPMSVSPALFTESVANAPAAQIAIACRALGPNLTVTQREAGALIALSQGATEIRTGRADSALVVAVDELHPMLHAVLGRFGALATRDSDGNEFARPFDRHRNGFIAGEGACALVLESESSARQRGGRILARLHAGASAFDPRAPRTGWSESPDLLATALSRFLQRCEVTLAEVDCIVSAASGSIPGDRLEALVLKSVWGGRPLPPILAPKASIGEHSGGLLSAAVLAAEGASFGPTPGFSTVDPELGISPHDGWPLGRHRRILVTSLAVGGAAAWCLLERGDT